MGLSFKSLDPTRHAKKAFSTFEGTGIGSTALDIATFGQYSPGGGSAGKQGQVTAGNVFRSLSPEQQKDFLINNPNVEGPTGSQYYDPNTNTIRLQESDFTEAQRGRQEALTAQLSGSLSGELTDTGLEGEAYQRGAELLRPQHEEQREQLEQRLADQGIPIGSEAYTREMDRLEKSQGSQLSNLGLQSIQASEQVRQQRFNEISSLLGTQQVGGVGFGQFSPQKTGLDVTGQHQADLARSDAKKAARYQAIGSLIGTAGRAFAGGV